MKYRQLVGAMMYLATHTRPDIVTAVNQLARFMSCYTATHWRAALHVLRYLSGTVDVGLVLRRDGPESLLAYADASYASDVDSRRSTTGYCFFYGNCPVRGSRNFSRQ